MKILCGAAGVQRVKCVHRGPAFESADCVKRDQMGPSADENEPRRGSACVLTQSCWHCISLGIITRVSIIVSGVIGFDVTGRPIGYLNCERIARRTCSGRIDSQITIALLSNLRPSVQSDIYRRFIISPQRWNRFISSTVQSNGPISVVRLTTRSRFVAGEFFSSHETGRQAERSVNDDACKHVSFVCEKFQISNVWNILK